MLALIDSHSLIFGALCSLVSFWAGFRSNLWLARRSEWNAVVDRVRVALLTARQGSPSGLDLSSTDIDLLLHQSGWFRRRKIGRTLGRHRTLANQYQQSSLGSLSYTPQQASEMAALREQLLTTIKRR